MFIFKTKWRELKKMTTVFSLIGFTLISTQLHAAGCDNNAISESTPDDRFVIISFVEAISDTSFPRIVRDTQTGLEWTYCALGLSGTATLSCSSGSAELFTWSEALAEAQTYSVTVGNSSDEATTTIDDWRLPNIKELASIVELCNEGPAINKDKFPDTPVGRYWSSSAFAPGSSVARGISFSSGFVNARVKNSNGFVRLVRSGQ